MGCAGSTLNAQRARSTGKRDCQVCVCDELHKAHPKLTTYLLFVLWYIKPRSAASREISKYFTGVAAQSLFMTFHVLWI